MSHSKQRDHLSFGPRWGHHELIGHPTTKSTEYYTHPKEGLYCLYTDRGNKTGLFHWDRDSWIRCFSDLRGLERADAATKLAIELFSPSSTMKD